MATTAAGSATKLALKNESVYGTPPVGTYFFVPAADFRLGSRQGFQDVDLIGQGRDPGRPERDPVIQTRGTARVPIDVRNVGYWLKGAFSGPTTGGTDPYTHEFGSGAASLPSFTIEEQFLDLSPVMYTRCVGVMVNGFTINFQPNGRAYLELDLYASAVTNETSSITGGGETTRAVERFTQAHASIKKDSVDLAKVVSCTLPFVNNIEEVYYVGGGGQIGDLNPGLNQTRGQLVTRLHPGLTAGLFDDAASETLFELELAFTNVGGDSLTFTMELAEVGKPLVEIAGPGGVQCTFDWAASANPGSAIKSIEVDLVNDVTNYT